MPVTNSKRRVAKKTPRKPKRAPRLRTCSLQLTKDIKLVIARDSMVNRARHFMVAHHKLILLLAILAFALGLAVLKEGSLAKLSLITFAGEAVQFCGDVIVDRLFPEFGDKG